MSDDVAGRKPIRSHRDLQVYQLAFQASMDVFRLTRGFPVEECYSLVDQIRRSSRSVSANIAEAWRKRRYEGSFVLKLNDAEAEAAETQAWLEYAVECGYADKTVARELYRSYDHILGKLVRMLNNPTPWLLPSRQAISGLRGNKASE
jgi:four helix bundle protein